MQELSVGTETLKRISGMQNFNKWIFQRIKNHIGKRVFEVGCGVGNLTQFFAGRELVVGCDIDKKHLETIRAVFGKRKNMQFVYQDAQKINVKKYGSKRFDTIVCLNVLEHIKDDRKALKNFYDILAPEGKLVLQVPAYPSLYCSFDKNLLHFRRYSRKGLLKKTTEAGFKTVECSYMNVCGVIGWLVNGKILRKNILPSEQLKGFDVLVPFMKPVDGLFRHIAGLSIIYAGKK